MEKAAILLLSLLSLSSLLPSQSQDTEPILVEGDLCVYTIFMGTGREWRSWAEGGSVGIKLCDSSNGCFSVKDLVSWGGQMWYGHEYFQWGSVDVFSGRNKCLSGEPCSMEITFSGVRDEKWFCEFVQVMSAGLGFPCYQKMFMVQQWLSVEEGGRKLMAARDECGRNETSRVLL